MNKSNRTLGKVKQQQRARQQYLVEQKNFDMSIEAQQFTLECRAEIVKSIGIAGEEVNEYVGNVWQFIKDNAKYPEIKVLSRMVLDDIEEYHNSTCSMNCDDKLDMDEDLKSSILKKWDIVKGIYKENNEEE